MATPAALDVLPINPAYKELEAIPLVDSDALITDFVVERIHLQKYCQLRNSHLDNSDMYGIWESNLPTYSCHL